MSQKLTWVLLLTLAGLSSVAAQQRPQIPPNELAGQERFRFIDQYPQRQSTPPVFVPDNSWSPPPRQKCPNGRTPRPGRGC